MKKPHRILFLLPCLGMTASALGQELSGSLTATGDYQAEIRSHSRLSGLPQRLLTQVPEGSLPVAVDALPVTVAPGLETLPATDSGLTLPRRYPGYVSLTAGSYLNASLSAGYRFVQTDRTTLGAWLQHNSSSLFRPDTEAPAPAEAPRKKLYDETLSLYGSHLFEGYGLLSASATYRLGYFNYYSSAADPEGQPMKAPTQTLNDFLLTARWQGRRYTRSWFVNADLKYRYFGYRSFYSPDELVHEDGGAAPLHAVRPPRENDIQLGATLGYTTYSSGAIALDVRLREIVFCHPHTAYDIASHVTRPFASPLSEMKPYGVATLTPSYFLTRDNWSLRAGARVDLSWNVVSATDFSTVHVAPDVAVSYAAPKATVYLSATGGVEPNTLASRSELNMYQSPALVNTLPQYSPLKAEIGVRLGDFSGFSAGVHAAYAIADNTPLTGWYPYWLAGQDFAPGQMAENMATMSLKGFSLGADVEYSLGYLLSVSGSMTYQRQSGKDGWFNGPDRPRWTADLGAEVTPLKGLAVGASYRYRGVRRIYLAEGQVDRAAYSQVPYHNFGDPDETQAISRRLPDIYDLGVHARYTLRDRFTFSAAVDNILGCDDRLNPLMPTEGLSITGGVSILF